MSVSTVRGAGALARVRTVRGHGPRAFVLVHGIGASSRYFTPLAARLRRHGDVHLVDLPGFGGVPRPRRPLTVQALGEVVHACLDNLRVADPVLVGHSMGAQVVVSLLTRRHLARHAVLVGPTVNPAEATARRQVLRLAQSARHESSRVRNVVVSDYARCGPRWFARELRAMLQHPMRAELAGVTASVLVVRGEHDVVAPHPWALEVAGRVPDGRPAVVAGAGHAVMHDRPDDVARLVVHHVGA